MDGPMENEEDAPPLLVVNNDSNADMGLDSELDDLSLVKVPITIVTGTKCALRKIRE